MKQFANAVVPLNFNNLQGHSLSFERTGFSLILNDGIAFVRSLLNLQTESKGSEGSEALFCSLFHTVYTNKCSHLLNLLLIVYFKPI